jgi:predicted RecB family nuclease
MAKNADSSYSRKYLLFHVQGVPKTLDGLRNEIKIKAKWKIFIDTSRCGSCRREFI